MLNHIVIMGRMTRDPELRRTGSGIAVANFTVAVDRDFGGRDGGEKETDFIDCVAWRQTGEFVSKYFSKGSMVVVSGRLQIRSWTDKEGNKRKAAEIVADNVYFGERKKSAESNGTYQGSGYGSAYPETEAAISRYSGIGQSSYAAPEYMKPDFSVLEGEDENLPF
ncbi:MAG: single-stranded DNA-binding protein [Faecousia sp.]